MIVLYCIVKYTFVFVSQTGLHHAELCQIPSYSRLLADYAIGSEVRFPVCRDKNSLVLLDFQLVTPHRMAILVQSLCGMAPCSLWIRPCHSNRVYKRLFNAKLWNTPLPSCRNDCSKLIKFARGKIFSECANH